MRWRRQRRTPFLHNQLDPFPYQLAALLGLTHADLQRRMSRQELERWRGVFHGLAAKRVQKGKRKRAEVPITLRDVF